MMRGVRVRAIPLAIALGAGFLFASCSSSASTAHGSQDVATVLNAAEKAARSGPATISGDVETAKHRGSVSGVYQGDLATGRGSVSLEVAVGGSASASVQLRWLAGTLYVERAVAPVSASVDPQLVRTQGERPWSTSNARSSLSGALPRAFDPPALLAALIQNPQGVTTQPGDKIGGNPTTVIRAPRVVVLGLWTNASATIWLDTRDRPVRVEITAPTGSTHYDIAYGGHVDVSAPPAADIETAAPARFVVTGPYAEVRSGRSGGVAWAVLRAPATNGYSCWKWRATPPLAALMTDTPDGARCVPAVSPADALADQIRFVYEPKTSGGYDAFVALVPPVVRGATIGTVGGTLTPLTDLGSPLVFVGSPQPPAAYLKLVTAHGSVECGRGAVSSVGDLRDELLTPHTVGSPWSC
jgi:hypothetical protein